MIGDFEYFCKNIMIFRITHYHKAALNIPSRIIFIQNAVIISKTADTDPGNEVGCLPAYI